MSRPLTVLALDLATTTGWALSRRGVVTSGFRKLSSDPVERVAQAENWLTFRLAGVDRVVVERAGYRHHSAMAVAAQLLNVLQRCAELEGAELIVVRPQDWKKHATGNGNADKQLVLDTVNERHGLELVSDDEADARALLDYALGELG